jgi:hypothetical protein
MSSPTASEPRPAPSATRPASAAQPTPSRAARQRLRLWPILLACPLIVLDNLWVVWMERVVQGPYVTTISLFGNAVFVLALLIAANALLRRVAPRAAMSQAELLLVYSMIAIASAFPALDGVSILIQALIHPYWFDATTPAVTRWGPYLPKELMLHDKAILRGLMNGSDTFYRPEYLAAWWKPALFWTLFTTVLVFVMQCINVLLRKQWAEREKLTFPITILPIEMTQPGGALWRSRLMWVGFALAGGIDLLNGFAYYYPWLPSVPVNFVNIQPWLRDKPWTAMGFTCYSFYPFAVGLGYLLPVDLLFSCWFFYLFWKLQLIVSSLMAWDVVPEFPFIKQQAFGGFMAILFFMFWISRRSVAGVFRQALHPRAGEMDDAGEGVTYRWALIGALGGSVLLAAFFAWVGLPPWLAGLSVFLFLAISVAITRVRAEFGPPVHDAHFSGPDSMLPVALGTQGFDARQLQALNWFWWFNRGYRSHAMPVGLENLRFAERTHTSQRTYFWATMLAVVLGVAATFWAYGHLGYQYGLAGKWASGTGHANQGYSRLAGWLSNPAPPNAAANWALVVGFVCAAALFLARVSLNWWPFHPIGYAISASWSINLVWMPLAIAWIIKLLVLRYGGLRAYRQLLPFFLGLILGETLVGCGWSLYGILAGVPTYSFWGG